MKVSDIQLGILIFMLNFIVDKVEHPSTFEAFWAVNSRRDGFIDECQLKAALTNIMSFSPKHASQASRELMIAIDVNASGDITYSGTNGGR